MTMDSDSANGAPAVTARASARNLAGRILIILIAAIATTLPITASPVGALNTPRAVTLNEASSHHTVAVNPDTRITVILHSTYWSLTPLGSNLTLSQVGASKVASVPGTAGCVPGQGCGTLRAHFVARHAGFIRLHATRTSCGEAMRCTPAQRVWTVVVHVR